MGKSDMVEQPKPNPTTELRVIIYEGPDGDLIVEHEGRVKDTSVVVQMRPSHIAGQLLAASYVVLAREYEALQSARTKKKKK
jgi:hypothetical protein